MFCLRIYLPHYIAIGLIALSALLQGGCQPIGHTHYSTSFKAAKPDLVKLKDADPHGLVLYLDRYSIVPDRKKFNWRHAMLISSIAPGVQAKTQQQQTSTSMEVTINCQNQRISIDLIRVHPHPLAQGEPINTQVFNDGFVTMREQQGMGKILYKEVCR